MLWSWFRSLTVCAFLLASIWPVHSHALSCLDPMPHVPSDFEGDVAAFVREFWIERLTLMYEDTNSIWVGILTEGAKGSLEERKEVRWSRSALSDLVKKEVFGSITVNVPEAYSFTGTVFDENGRHDVDGQAVSLIYSCQVDGGAVCSAPYPTKQAVVIPGYWFASGAARLEPWQCPSAIPQEVLEDVFSSEVLEEVVRSFSK